MVDPRDHLVSDQYEGYPYPDRDPKDERKRLIEGSPSDLAEIRHYLFAGGLPDTGGEPFRALIAGGGTGDAAIMLAQHCASTDLSAEITYLDLSSASRRITEERAEARGLSNLRFVSGSLLDAAKLAPGPYDYIDCCGVLHHLEEPEAGLASLAAILKPSGGMGLMVYGTLGRRGIYETQELLRTIAPVDLPDQERIARTKRLLDKLPKTNWLRRNPFVQDHRNGGDAGIYDLLLHARDRAYRVAEFAALIESAGLSITSFIQAASYEPETYLNDPTLLSPLASLSLTERAAAAESLAGNMRKHVVYATPNHRASHSVASPENLALIPSLHRQQPKLLAEALRRGKLQINLDGYEATFPAPKRASAITSRMDGQRSLAEIAADLRTADTALSEDEACKLVQQTFRYLNNLNVALLRTPG